MQLIDLYTGTPGSGKSLHAAQVIRNRLIRGLPVIANFYFNTSKVRKDDKFLPFYMIDTLDITVGFLQDFAIDYWAGKKVKEDEITLVIDEAQLIFNAREWSRSGRMEWLSFFSQHRKYGYHIILCCQFDLMIDKQIRSLVEFQYVHRKVTNFGLKGFVVALVKGGANFMIIKNWYAIHEVISKEYLRANKKLYGMYDSYAAFGKEKKPTV